MSADEQAAALEHNRWLGASLGRNGRQFYRDHYDWSVIVRKYLDVFTRLQAEPTQRTIEPFPGWFERRARNLPAAREILATL